MADRANHGHGFLANWSVRPTAARSQEDGQASRPHDQIHRSEMSIGWLTAKLT